MIPDDELLPGLHIVSVSNIAEFSNDAKPYDIGPDDLKNMFYIKYVQN